MAKSRVTFGVIVYLPVRPGSNLIGSFTILPGSSIPAASWAELKVARRFPVSDRVRLGINSSVRSAEIPSRPERCPSCASQLEMSRFIGIHISSSLLKRLMRRQKCAPHNLSLPATYLSDLKGIATSTVHPSEVNIP